MLIVKVVAGVHDKEAYTFLAFVKPFPQEFVR